MSTTSGPGYGAAAAVLQWFDAAGRDLPWRRLPRTPYRVLVAEAMLQQTRVETVAPRYEAFLLRFPDLPALARASREEVLRSWEGLGYYARGRNLHRLAQEVVAAQMALPADRAALLRLPGIGDYIASAVRSFAFGIADPPLDANLRRIALRYLGVPGDPLRADASGAARTLLDDWFLHAPPARLADALMDLGAQVCTARAPRCDDCPLQGGCTAAGSGAAQAFGVRPRHAPPPLRRILAAQVVSTQGQAWRQRPETGLLGGLWEPPHVLSDGDSPTLDMLLAELRRWGVSDARAQSRPWPLRHAFTHQVWEGEVIRLVADGGALAPPARWLDDRAIAEVAIPSAFRSVLREGA